MSELFLGVMDLNEAKFHQLKLADRGVKIDFKVNDQTCTSGCKVTVEVWAQEENEGQIRDYFKSQHDKNLSGHNVDVEAINSVFDSNMSEVQCQACGTKFSPQSGECPDCGLVYF